MSCTAPPEIANGYVSYDSLTTGTSWSDSTVISYRCFNYYDLVGTDTLLCSASSWAGDIPICEFNRDTEIVAGFVIAVIVIMLLLLIGLLIFICCYFGICCGNKRGNFKVADDGY